LAKDLDEEKAADEKLTMQRRCLKNDIALAALSELRNHYQKRRPFDPP
jgi:hypothetical protein